MKHKEVRMFTREEFGRLVAECKHQDTKDIMLILRESGCRAREIIDIERKDIDFRGGWAVMIVHGKCGCRTVPVNETAPILMRYAEGKLPADRLFLHPYITHYCRMAVLMKRLDIHHGDKNSAVFHALRHMAFTEDLARGVPPDLARKKMGWSRRSRMPGVYEHLQSEDIIRWEMRNGPNSMRFSPLFFWVNNVN